MTIIKSFSIGNGDMFAIRHASDNFTMIDCCLNDENKERILKEIRNLAKGKNIQRFISTHPDKDHIAGLSIIINNDFPNFYCVENQINKVIPYNDFNFRNDFNRYIGLKNIAFRNQNFLKSGVSFQNTGIQILWPNINNLYFIKARIYAENSDKPNNISPIIQWSNGYFNFLWFGDLETNFMENITNDVLYKLPNGSNLNIIFAPHHGRDSGKLPITWLQQLKPCLIIIGEAPSEHLNYYRNYNTITQNSARDITFIIDDCDIEIYVSKQGYTTKIDNEYFCAEKSYYIDIENCKFDLGYKLFP